VVNAEHALLVATRSRKVQEVAPLVRQDVTDLVVDQEIATMAANLSVVCAVAQACMWRGDDCTSKRMSYRDRIFMYAGCIGAGVTGILSLIKTINDMHAMTKRLAKAQGQYMPVVPAAPGDELESKHAMSITETEMPCFGEA
jgi:hypothetical protein